jgi:hypothetical protein
MPSHSLYGRSPERPSPSKQRGGNYQNAKRLSTKNFSCSLSRGDIMTPEWILHGKAYCAKRPASHPLSARRHLKCCLQYVSGEAIFTIIFRYSSPAAGHARIDA